MRNSDLCLSIRMINPKASPGQAGSFEAALALIDQFHPTRLEWSYITDREQIGQLKARVPLFVATLNTIYPPGHSRNFEGDPIVAPWMKTFGTPGARMTYICQNNPADGQVRMDQALAMISAGITESFQFDDWYCNAQMIQYKNPCFCEYCMAEFSTALGLPFEFNYHQYLRKRGITHTAQLLELAKRGAVPLWDDYVRFADQTVTFYFRKLKAALDHFAGHLTSLSVNGSVLEFGGRIETILPFIDYFNGETPDFTPATLLRMAEASRQTGKRQVVSFFPDVPATEFDTPVFVGRVNQAVTLCYCLGLLPLYPYDVYSGSDLPRWYARWQDYQASYETVRSHPEYFDEFAYETVEIEPGRVVVVTRHTLDAARRLRHTLYPDGKWDIEPA
jgi:hypothetical protein